jgi:hypothetical protein
LTSLLIWCVIVSGVPDLLSSQDIPVSSCVVADCLTAFDVPGVLVVASVSAFDITSAIDISKVSGVFTVTGAPAIAYVPAIVDVPTVGVDVFVTGTSAVGL